MLNKELSKMLKSANKKILYSFLLIAFLFSTGSQALASNTSDNWPMFHHDLTHTGYSSSTPTTVASTLLWNFTTNIPVSASPTIVDGKVYVGSLGGIAYCLNATDGSSIWNYTVQARTQGRYGSGAPAIGSSMAVAGGYVYFGSYDRNVYCLKAETGDKVWNFTTGNTVESSPSISNGYVYIGSWDGNVYCLDALTGSKIWNYTTGSQVESSPAIAEGKVYVGSVDYNVYCLDALTGDKIWSYKTGNLVQSSPAVVDGRVYIGSEDMNFYCLDASTGVQLWNFNAMGWVDSSPAVYNGYVYFGCTVVNANQDDLPSNVYCLKASTGEKVWNYTMKGGASYSSPAVVVGLLYIGDWAHNIYCLDATTGAEKWIYTTQAHVNSSPAIANGNVYVASWDHTIYAFGTQSTTTLPSSFSISSESTLLIGIAFSVLVIVAAILVLRRRKHV
jgi:eukaryotic-like serine/threonine-protein kinase